MALLGTQTRDPGFYWVKVSGDWSPGYFDGHGWFSATGSGWPAFVHKQESEAEEIGEPCMRLVALKLQPGDMLLATLRAQDDPSNAVLFLRNFLSREGLDNSVIVLLEGQRLSAFSDEQLAAIGLERAGSWRDRPPLF